MNTIKLYSNVPLNVKNNYIIDDIDLFLENYEIEVIEHFMFIDTSKLENSIILNYNYDEVDYASKAFSGVNYISLEQAGRTYYYFVYKSEFASKNAVRLQVRLDTLNTFNNCYTVSNRTLILREHKDRFYNNQIEIVTSEGLNLYYPRKIDRVSEGIQPSLYNISSDYIKEPNIWYLIYRNQNPITDQEGNLVEVNPVECLIQPKEEITLNVDTSKNYGSTSFQPRYAYYCIFDKGYNSIRLGNTTYSLEEGATGASASNVKMLWFEVNDETGEFTGLLYFGDNTTLTFDAEIGIEFRGEWDYINYVTDASEILPDVEEMRKRGETLYPKYYINTHVTDTPNTIDAIDRTDSRLIKIIEVPYPPLDINPDNLQEEFLKYYDGYFTLKDLNTAFSYNLGDYKITEMTYRSITNENVKSQIANHEWEIQSNLESKLYHSNFRYEKIYYDSFSFILPYELIDGSVIESSDILEYTIDFIPTTTINSRFLFKLGFNDNELWDDYLQDFNFVLNVARSNELTIYNNAYINYLRAGYNYDVKTKQRNITSNWVGVGLSAIGTVAAFASSAITGGVGVAAGIGLATSTASQVYNAVTNQIQTEQNFEAKMHQLEMQSTAVYGADDVDLLNAYGGQGLKSAIYDLSAPMKNLILKLFYLCGYTSNRYGVPAMNTRTIFDFCQANIIFENTNNIPEEMQVDIAARFSEGVYDFHKLTYPDNTNGWDLSFTHENLETWLYYAWRS